MCAFDVEHCVAISWHLHMYNILTYDVLFPGTEVELPASIILLVAQVVINGSTTIQGDYNHTTHIETIQGLITLSL